MKKILWTSGLAAAALLTLSACSPSADAASVAGIWGDPAALDTPSLEFDGTASSGEFSGTDGCNRVGGTYSVKGDEVNLGAMHSTLMFCEGVDTWLGNATTAKISGDELIFSDEAGTEIGSLQRAAGTGE